MGEETENDDLCIQCLGRNVAESETDEDGIFWTRCRSCGFWTEH